MDTHITQQALLSSPAIALIGNAAQNSAHTIVLLKQLWCKNNVCNVCIVCTQITQQQFHSMLWIKPEKNYTLESLQVIFETICFSRSAQDPYYFILDRADSLTPATSNALLKVLEEPMPGYHFILLSQRAESLLQTIRSRCIIFSLTKEMTVEANPFLQFFSHNETADPITFYNALEKSAPSENESALFLDQLVVFEIEKIKQLHGDNKDYSDHQRRLAILHNALTKQIMPGSSKLFWKNLFIAFKQLPSQ